MSSAAKKVTAASSEEARHFLQERLALLGLSYGLIGLAFYTVATMAASGLPNHSWKHVASSPELGAIATYLVLWLVCRRGRRSERTLHVVDAFAVTLVAACASLLVFVRFPGEMPGMPYARALLLFTFGLVLRATVVPSSAARTLVLGLFASVFPVVTIHLWSAGKTPENVPPLLSSFFTANWCLGGVVIATVASRVIFGLRQQVRKARQLGQYTLLEKIGEGGMGAVFRASHAMLRRPTAVKLLLPERAGARSVERFEREVQLTSSLTHPNTVGIFDYGRTPDGIFYYAMEYLDGVNLEDLVRLDGPQRPARVVHMLRQVLGALGEAHGIGLIHRDIKPANVILVAQRGGALDVAKVVDFGLVKEVDHSAHITREGLFVGTPHYVAPETVLSPDGVDARSDIYSIGCLAYFLVTGQNVFEGTSVVEVAGHHLNSIPVPPSERLGRPLPEKLSEIILDCLEKNPDRRPQSARALLARLDTIRDVGDWTDEEARAWWRAMATARQEKRTAVAALETSGLTISRALDRDDDQSPIARIAAIE